MHTKKIPNHPASSLTDLRVALASGPGYAVIENLLDAATVGAICQRLSNLAIESDAQGNHPAIGPGAVQFEPGFAVPDDLARREIGVRKFFYLVPGDPFFCRLAADPCIIEPVQAVLGANVQLFQCMAMVKPPKIGGPKDWHQDRPYFPIRPSDGCLGVWVALDNATLENGCMEFVPGSQRAGLVPHEQGPTGWRLSPALAAQAQAQAVRVPVPAGSAVFFDSCTWHFTDHNRSQHRRRAFQCHYVSATTRRTSPASDPRQELWPVPG